MLEILKLCGYLGILVAINILCSIYYNKNVREIKFDANKLFNGIYKVVIIALSFVGLTFVFQQMPDLAESIGIEPRAIMMASIVLYGGFAIKSLADILKVKVIK